MPVVYPHVPREMRENTDMPIEEVARTCGFCSPSHLGTRLREATGKSQRVYRIARE